jgi:hypothetical protein
MNTAKYLRRSMANLREARSCHRINSFFQGDGPVTVAHGGPLVARLLLPQNSRNYPAFRESTMSPIRRRSPPNRARGSARHLITLLSSPARPRPSPIPRTTVPTATTVHRRAPRDDVSNDRLPVQLVFIGLPIDAESAEVIENDARFKIERRN